MYSVPSSTTYVYEIVKKNISRNLQYYYVLTVLQFRLNNIAQWSIMELVLEYCLVG